MAKKTKTPSKKTVAKGSSKAKPSSPAKPSAKAPAKPKTAGKKPTAKKSPSKKAVAPAKVSVAKQSPGRLQTPTLVTKASPPKSAVKKGPEKSVAPASEKKSTPMAPPKTLPSVVSGAPAQVEDVGAHVPKIAPTLMGRKSAGAGRPPTEKKTKRRETPLVDRDGDIRAQWQALFDRSKEIEPIAYKMSDNYEAKTPILHKTLGWGYVVSNVNNRLEVLFESGLKFLISNYKVG